MRITWRSAIRSVVIVACAGAALASATMSSGRMPGRAPAPPGGAGSTAVPFENEISRIAAKIIELPARERAPGLAIAISQGGKLIFSKGYGAANLETGTLVRPDTVFRIGSITKEFTAAAIMLLVEQGKLSLEDPLSKHLGEIPDGDKVTIRNLLNHTSGLHSYTGGSTSTDLCVDKTTDAMVSMVVNQTKLYDFPPGTAWDYSNSGYYLLGAIIEKTSGISLRDYFKIHLLQPLGMEDTAIDQTREVVPNRASGYKTDRSPAAGFERADFYPMTRPGGAGALRSTALDLVLWHDALFAGRVVSHDSVRQMIEPGRVSDGRMSGQAWFHSEEASQMPDLQYGLGLMHGEDGGHAWIGHSGGINGFSAWLKTYPKQQLTIAILSNSGGGAIGAEKEIVPILLKSLAGIPPKDSSRRSGFGTN